MSRASTPLATATLALAVLCSSCKGTPVQVGDYLPPDVDRSRGRQVEGEASGFQLFHFIPISNNDRHARAYADLVSAAGDSYITNVQVKEGWTWAAVGTVYHTTFRATAYPKTSAMPKTGTASAPAVPDETPLDASR
jgi:hypothetical protein